MSDQIAIVPIRRERNEEVVEALERLLARARAGQLLDITWCGSIIGGAMNHGYTRTDDLLQVSAQLTRMQHQVQLRLDRNEMPASEIPKDDPE